MERSQAILLLNDNDEALRATGEWLHQNSSYVSNGEIVLQKLYNAADRNVPGSWRALRSLKAQALGNFFEDAIAAPWESAEQLIRRIDTVEKQLLEILQEFPGAEVHHMNAVCNTDVYPREWSFKDILMTGAHIEAMGGNTGITSRGTLSISKQGHRTGKVSAHMNLRDLWKHFDDPPKNSTSTWKNSGFDIASTGGEQLPHSLTHPTKHGIYWDDALIDVNTGTFKPKVTPQQAAEALMPASVEPQQMIATVAYNRPNEALSRRVLSQASGPDYNPSNLIDRNNNKNVLDAIGFNQSKLVDNLEHDLSGRPRIDNPQLKLPPEIPGKIQNITNQVTAGDLARTTLRTKPNVIQLKHYLNSLRISGKTALGTLPIGLGNLTGFGTDLIPSEYNTEQLRTADMKGEGMGEALTNYGLDSAKNIATGLATAKLLGGGLSKAKLLANPYTAAAGLTIGGAVLANSLVDVASGITRAHYPSHTDDPKDSYGLRYNTKAATEKVNLDIAAHEQRSREQREATAADVIGDTIHDWGKQAQENLNWLKNLFIN